jgi:hypothetical protein
VVDCFATDHIAIGCWFGRWCAAVKIRKLDKTISSTWIHGAGSENEACINANGKPCSESQKVSEKSKQNQMQVGEWFHRGLVQLLRVSLAKRRSFVNLIGGS